MRLSTVKHFMSSLKLVLSVHCVFTFGICKKSNLNRKWVNEWKTYKCNMVFIKEILECEESKTTPLRLWYVTLCYLCLLCKGSGIKISMFSKYLVWIRFVFYIMWNNLLKCIPNNVNYQIFVSKVYFYFSLIY